MSVSRFDQKLLEFGRLLKFQDVNLLLSRQRASRTTVVQHVESRASVRLGWEVRANTDSALSDNNNPRVIINRRKTFFSDSPPRTTTRRVVVSYAPLVRKKREAILNNPDAWSGWLSHYSRPGMMDALHNCVRLLSGFLEDLRLKH